MEVDLTVDGIVNSLVQIKLASEQLCSAACLHLKLRLKGGGVVDVTLLYLLAKFVNL